MKRNIFCAVIAFFAFGFSIAQAQDSHKAFFGKADAFFKAHVKDGLVGYKAIKSDPSALNGLVKQVAGFPAKAATPQVRKAFYINAYNLLVIKSIVDRYPTKSPMDINGFFDGQKHLVGGDKLTLNQLEKEKLLKPTKDARLHFVLVCAAISCPRIANFAYLPDQLDKQMETQTKLALNDASFIRPQGSKVLVSEIFKWYAQDFTNDAGSIANYLNKYRASKVDNKAKIGYYTYNWSLNQR